MTPGITWGLTNLPGPQMTMNHILRSGKYQPSKRFPQWSSHVEGRLINPDIPICYLQRRSADHPPLPVLSCTAPQPHFRREQSAQQRGRASPKSSCSMKRACVKIGGPPNGRLSCVFPFKPPRNGNKGEVIPTLRRDTGLPQRDTLVRCCLFTRRAT